MKFERISQAPRLALEGWVSISVEDPQCDREGEAQIGLAKIPPGELFDTPNAIGGGVAVDAERAARLG